MNPISVLKAQYVVQIQTSQKTEFDDVLRQQGIMGVDVLIDNRTCSKQ